MDRGGGEGGGELTPPLPPKKLPLNSPALLGLTNLPKQKI